MRKLDGKTVAILATNGFEQVELTRPKEAVENAGAEVHLVSLNSDDIQGVNGMEKGESFSVDKKVAEVSASDYDGLIIPGGLYNPDALRSDTKAIAFVREFFDQGKPVSAICHGPWVLAEANVIDGRKLTSYHSIQTDLKNAGAEWVDEEVVVDSGLTTSRNPGDLDAFCRKTVEEMCEGKHQGQTV